MAILLGEPRDSFVRPIDFQDSYSFPEDPDDPGQAIFAWNGEDKVVGLLDISVPGEIGISFDRPSFWKVGNGDTRTPEEQMPEYLWAEQSALDRFQGQDETTKVELAGLSGGAALAGLALVSAERWRRRVLVLSYQGDLWLEGDSLDFVAAAGDGARISIVFERDRHLRAVEAAGVVASANT